MGNLLGIPTSTKLDPLLPWNCVFLHNTFLKGFFQIIYLWLSRHDLYYDMFLPYHRYGLSSCILQPSLPSFLDDRIIKVKTVLLCISNEKFTFDLLGVKCHHSILCPSRHMSPSWRHSLKVFLKCHIHKNEENLGHSNFDF